MLVNVVRQNVFFYAFNYFIQLLMFSKYNNACKCSQTKILVLLQNIIHVNVFTIYKGL